MRDYLKIFFVAVVISVFGVSCIQAQESKKENFVAAQDFKLKDLSQNTVTLSEYKGKQPVVLFFWATWCPYCRRELGTLKEKYPYFAKKGLELLVINIGESRQRVESFVKANGLNLKVLLDEKGDVANSFAIFGVPTYIFIDKNGDVVAQEHYFSEERFAQFFPR